MDTSGRSIRGWFVSADGEGLTLITNGAATRIDESSTAIISRDGDSVWSGMLMGFGVGVAYTVGVGVAEDCFFNCKGFGPGFGGALMVYGGIGAGIGTLTDWLVRGQTEVFRAAAYSARVRLAPLLLPGRRGVAVSIAFR